MKKRLDGKPRATSRLSPADFAQIWQSSRSKAEVIKRTGWSPLGVSSYASRLRCQHGVPLKRFKLVKIDWRKVRAAAKKAARAAR